jgi:predicted N-acetyltransferase YhbS
MSNYEERLGDGLVLRTVRDDRDIDRYQALHSVVVSVTESITCGHLPRHHPESGYDDFVIVEDEQTGELLSTTCLIPWHCSYDGLPLRVAMLEMVVTHPQHRHRGLIRAQVKHFHRAVEERGFDLSIIEGIPYYYRQFGYAYAVDHRSYDALAAWRVPDASHEDLRFVLRQATPGDAPLLADLYQAAMRGVAFHTSRDAAYWHYLLEWAQFPVSIVVDERSSSPVGYVTRFSGGQGRGVYVAESSIESYKAAMTVLRLLKRESGGEIRVAWPESGTLVQILRSLDSQSFPTYQWLVRIADIPAFLTKIGPVLERRLALGGCGDLTTDLIINLFRQAYRLRLAAGKFAGVESIGFMDTSMGADGGDLCIPPDAFVRLLCGYRDLDELRDAWPDIVIRSRSRRWLDLLFPKMTSYWCMPYLYNGPAG